MEYVIKESLNYPNLSLEQLYEFLITLPKLPSFNKEEWIKRMNVIREKEQPNKLQFYIEDKTYLSNVESIYQQIILYPEGINYQELADKILKKLKLSQVSHYCRKLYNHNLIDISCKSHFKQVKATKYLRQLVQLPPLQIKQEEQKVSYYQEMNFFSNLIHQMESKGLRLQELMERMDKEVEGKSLSKLIEHLLKQELLFQQAERMGKIFTYKYQSKLKLKKWPTQNQQSNQQQAYEYQAINVIYFDNNVKQELQQLLKMQGDNDEIAKQLNELMSGQNRRKCQLSRSKANRFAIICNLIKEEQIVNIKDLKNTIQMSEQDENNGLIDNRTIKNFIKTLADLGFCKIHYVSAKIVSKECQRMLVSHHLVQDDDPFLQDAKEGLKIIDSRQQQVQQQAYSEESSESEKVFEPSGYKEISKRSLLQQEFGKKLNEIEKIFEEKNTKWMKTAFQLMIPKYDIDVVNKVFQNSNKNSCLKYLIILEDKMQKRDNSISSNFESIEEWEKETAEHQIPKYSMNQISNISNSEQKNVAMKFWNMENRYDYQALEQVGIHIKNFLLRYPSQKLQKLHSVFPQLNLYILLQKLLNDKTIEITVNGRQYNLEECLQNHKLEQIDYRINSNFLGYFL